MFRIYGGATEFKQWELDQMVTNPCMKAGDEVVFRNASGETYVVKAFEQNGEVVADVPNYLLQKALNILVDLEQGADKHDDCRTIFTVAAQDMPDGYDCQCNLPDRPVKTAGGVSSWNDLTDKPFGTEIGMVEVLGETTAVADESIGFGLTQTVTLEEGKKYAVKFNGVEYQSVAVSFGDALVLVNEGMDMTTGEGAVFVIAPTSDPYTTSDGTVLHTFVQVRDGSTTVTLSIHTEREIVKKISGKYVEGMGWSTGDTVEVDSAKIVDSTPHYSTFQGGPVMYRMSELTPSKEEILGGIGVELNNDGIETFTITNACITDKANTDSKAYRITKENQASLPFSLFEVYLEKYNDIEPGIYFAVFGSQGAQKLSWGEVHTIDPKYIPGGAGGGGFVVNVVLDADNAFVSADKTYAEIEAAILAGQMPIVKADMSASNGSEMYLFASCVQIITGMMIIFAAYMQLSTGLFACTVDDSWDVMISNA